MRFLAAIGALAILAAVASGVYFFDGYFDVAALNGGNAAVEWAVAQVREASIDRHAHAPSVPAWFNDAKTVRAGAHEFTEEGCVLCHGAPGQKREKFTQGMNPKPPDLAVANADDPPGYVFWIVRHGIRMTAMPAFGGHVGDDEIWRVVSFIKHLSKITPADYKAWRGGEPEQGGTASPSTPPKSGG